MDSQCTTTTAAASASSENVSGLAGSGVTSTSSTNIVAIPVPVMQAEDIYTYIAVRGSLHDTNAAIFGLDREEIAALSKRFHKGSTEIVNGVMITGSPIQVINSLSKLGYKVISSTGDAEIIWTMQREI